MPRPSAVRAATVVFFVGLGVAIAGVVLIQSRKALGFALGGTGFLIVVASMWISTLGRADRDGDPRSRGG